MILGQVPLEILVVTYNHAREPQDIDFEDMFPNHQQYNIIAFAGQECVENVEEKVNLIANYLGKDYNRVDFIGKGQIFLVVFVKVYDWYFMRELKKSYVMKDILGYGWKGGTMIQFTLYDTSFSFINCHLESGQNAVDKRLKMAQSILREISVENGSTIEPDAIADVNFFLGDLNFRFNRTYTEHVS